MARTGLGIAAGCSGGGDGGPPTDSGDPPGACGAVTYATFHVTGTVEDDDHQPVADVDLVLEERNWSPGTVHGTARTDATGAFVLDGADMPVVEDCWGTAVQYWLVGTRGELAGEKPMNALLVTAWLDGLDDVDLGQFPLVVR